MSPEEFRNSLQDYFEQLEPGESEEIRSDKVEWRLMCFDRGLEYANYINDKLFDLEGKQMIDVACAWGGHSLAFATLGASIIGGDLNNHEFTKLSQFAVESGFDAEFVQANCEAMPFSDASADVMLALDLIEHINYPDRFAKEVARVLKVGGVCIITTPARLRSLLLGEPHWGLRGLAALPFSMQPKIARGLFRKDYPFPITRQYATANRVINEFTPFGLTGQAILGGVTERLAKKNGLMSALFEKYFWKLIIITKP